MSFVDIINSSFIRPYNIPIQSSECNLLVKCYLIRLCEIIDCESDGIESACEIIDCESEGTESASMFAHIFVH